MKRFYALTLIIILLLADSGVSFAADKDPVFSDVPEDAWYAPYVDVCYREGLINGVGDGKFNPDEVVSLADMYVACARLHCYLTGIAIPEIPENGLRELVYFTGLDGDKIATLDDLKLMTYGGGRLILTFSDESQEKFRCNNEPLESIQIHLDIFAPFWIQVYTCNYTVDPKGSMSYELPYSDGLWNSDEANVFDDIVMLSFESLQTSGKWFEAPAWYIHALDIASWREVEIREYLEPHKAIIHVEYPRADLTNFLKMNNACPRITFAYFLFLSIPDEYLTPINEVQSIPDFNTELLVRLYQAGILNGIDDFGTFDGKAVITRAQLAYVLARVVSPEYRFGV